MIDGKRFRSSLDKTMAEMALALATELQGRIQASAPVASNALRSSFVSFIGENPFGVDVSIGSPLYESYGRFVEFGTEPHLPPYEPIRRWVEEKIQPHVLSVGVEFSTGRALPKRAGTKRLGGDARSRAIHKITQAVRYAIAKRGTRAQGFVRGAITSLGLGYTVEATAQGKMYSIDFSSWVGSNSFWDRVTARL